MKKVFLVLALLISSFAFAQNSPQTKSIKQEMIGVYSAFKEIQEYFINPKLVDSEDGRSRLVYLLGVISENLHKVESFNNDFVKQAGFKSNLDILNEMLDDASARLKEQRTDYAMWRIKTISNHCVSCHTSYKVDLNFSDLQINKSELRKLNNYEKGDFYLSTRQFDQAKEAFLKAALDANDASGYSRLDAIRKWLIIYTRVKPNPHEALTALTRFYSSPSLSKYERDVVVKWVASLRRWSSENTSFKVSPVIKAENLIRQALGMNDPISSSEVGTVELLRATAILHEAIEKGTLSPFERSQSLYLLGLSYSKLPLFFINELPEVFLELCIRDYPRSKDAKKSYSLYQEIITLGYTGSGGVHLPSDVQLKLNELHDIAYGVN